MTISLVLTTTTVVDISDVNIFFDSYFRDPSFQVYGSIQTPRDELRTF